MIAVYSLALITQTQPTEITCGAVKNLYKDSTCCGPDSTNKEIDVPCPKMEAGCKTGFKDVRKTIVGNSAHIHEMMYDGMDYKASYLSRIWALFTSINVHHTDGTHVAYDPTFTCDQNAHMVNYWLIDLDGPLAETGQFSFGEIFLDVDQQAMHAINNNFIDYTKDTTTSGLDWSDLDWYNATTGQTNPNYIDAPLRGGAGPVPFFSTFHTEQYPRSGIADYSSINWGYMKGYDKAKMPATLPTIPLLAPHHPFVMRWFAPNASMCGSLKTLVDQYHDLLRANFVGVRTPGSARQWNSIIVDSFAYIKDMQDTELSGIWGLPGPDGCSIGLYTFFMTKGDYLSVKDTVHAHFSSFDEHRTSVSSDDARLAYVSTENQYFPPLYWDTLSNAHPNVKRPELPRYW